MIMFNIEKWTGQTGCSFYFVNSSEILEFFYHSRICDSIKIRIWNDHWNTIWEWVHICMVFWYTCGQSTSTDSTSHEIDKRSTSGGHFDGFTHSLKHIQQVYVKPDSVLIFQVSRHLWKLWPRVFLEMVQSFGSVS